MKPFKLFIFLLLISLQAGATGYSHNMFVAHKKLQEGKETYHAVEKAVVSKPLIRKAKVKIAGTVPQKVQVKAALAPAATLNERILEEGPAAMFSSDDAEESQDSVVTKLVDLVRCVIYAFIGLPALA